MDRPGRAEGLAIMEKETPKLCARPQSRFNSCLYPNWARRPSSASSPEERVLSIGGSAMMKLAKLPGCLLELYVPRGRCCRAGYDQRRAFKRKQALEELTETRKVDSYATIRGRRACILQAALSVVYNPGPWSRAARLPSCPTSKSTLYVIRAWQAVVRPFCWSQTANGPPHSRVEEDS